MIQPSSHDLGELVILTMPSWSAVEACHTSLGSLKSLVAQPSVCVETAVKEPRLPITEDQHHGYTHWLHDEGPQNKHLTRRPLQKHSLILCPHTSLYQNHRPNFQMRISHVHTVGRHCCAAVSCPSVRAMKLARQHCGLLSPRRVCSRSGTCSAGVQEPSRSPFSSHVGDQC